MSCPGCPPASCTSGCSATRTGLAAGPPAPVRSLTARSPTRRSAPGPKGSAAGQQQRVATARALITRPALLFADEPTGNLDSRSATELLTQIRRAVDEYQQSVVMVTHDPRAAAYADRVLFLADGRLVRELPGPTVDLVLNTIRELGGEGGAGR